MSGGLRVKISDWVERETAHSPGIISPFVRHRVTGAEHGCLDTELSHNAHASGGNEDCEHIAHMTQSSQLSESAE